LVLHELLTELVKFGFEFGDAAVAFAAAGAAGTSGSPEGTSTAGSGRGGQERAGDARAEVHLHQSGAEKGKGDNTRCFQEEMQTDSTVIMYRCLVKPPWGKAVSVLTEDPNICPTLGELLTPATRPSVGRTTVHFHLATGGTTNPP